MDRRPVLVALAGPNGAGKTTFYHAHLEASGLRFLNPDRMAMELRLTPEDTAKAADALRRELVAKRTSFIFETVFSDPVGDKIGFLKNAATAGYAVVLCFIGLAGSETSEERVAMRVSQGGHDVSTEKLVSRYPRTLANLRTAIRELPAVYVFDNENLQKPYRLTAIFAHGEPMRLLEPVPKWLVPLLSHER